MRSKRVKKSGKVLATQPGSAMRMPGTRRPSQRKAHRHAVVVVGRDRAAVQGGRGRSSGHRGARPPGRRGGAVRSRRRRRGRSPCRRVCARPRIVTGPLAKGAIAASVCAVSEISAHVGVDAAQLRRAVHGDRRRRRARPCSPSAPARRRRRGRPAPRRAPGRRRARVPPVTAAAAKK